MMVNGFYFLDHIVSIAHKIGRIKLGLDQLITIVAVDVEQTNRQTDILLTWIGIITDLYVIEIYVHVSARWLFWQNQFK